MARVIYEHYTFVNLLRHFGPFDAADTGIGTNIVLKHFDKNTYLDQLSLLADILSTVAVTIRFLWADDGQSLGAAFTANQFLTDTIAIGTSPDLVAATHLSSEDDLDATPVFNMDGQTAAPDAVAPREFNQGDRLFIRFSASATTLAGLTIGAALREAVQ